jgi:hypothetical protein
MPATASTTEPDQFPIFVMPKIKQMAIAWQARAITPVSPRSISGDIQ